MCPTLHACIVNLGCCLGVFVWLFWRGCTVIHIEYLNQRKNLKRKLISNLRYVTNTNIDLSVQCGGEGGGGGYEIEREREGRGWGVGGGEV